MSGGRGAVERIAEAPTRWPPHLHGTRRYLLRRFPFSFVCRQIGSVLTIVAVVRAKHRPWWEDVEQRRRGYVPWTDERLVVDTVESISRIVERVRAYIGAGS